MKIIIWACLIAQMKRLYALITTQKTSTLCNVPLLKQSRKLPKNYFFSKITVLVVFPDFFSNGAVLIFFFCNQCILTSHLSYQVSIYGDFHFLGYKGFLQFCITTTLSIILFFILRKMSPPYLALGHH